jgi:hypothetical protein
MRKKLVLGTILTLSLLIVTVVAAVGPAFANPKDNSVDLYGTLADVSLTLLPSSVGPPPMGVPAHPTTIGFAIGDYNKRSETGAFDLLFIAIWVQSINAFMPIAQVYDIPVPSWAKQLFNSTGSGNPLYYETSAGVKTNNLIQVADKELDIWTDTSTNNRGRYVFKDSSRTYHDDGGCNVASNTLMVNLTRSVFINYTSSNPLIGNLSFTLPPMTIEFHEIGEGWYVEDPGKAGTWLTFEKSIEVPAWVEVNIPSWCRNFPFKVVGNLNEQATETFTPPT